MTEEYSLDKEIVFYGLYPQVSHDEYEEPLYAESIKELETDFSERKYINSKVIFGNIRKITLNCNLGYTNAHMIKEIDSRKYRPLGNRLNLIILINKGDENNVYVDDNYKYKIVQKIVTDKIFGDMIQPCLIKMVSDQGKTKVFKPYVSIAKKERDIIRNEHSGNLIQYLKSKDFYDKIIAETKVSFGVYVLEESVKDALRTLNQNVAKKVIENERAHLNSEIALLKENQQKNSLGTFINNLKNVVNNGIKQVGIEIMKNDSSISKEQKRQAKAQLIHLGIDNLKNSVLANMMNVFNQSKIALLEKQKTELEQQKTELEQQKEKLNTQKEAAEAKTKTSNISNVISKLQFFATTQMKQIGNQIRNDNIKTSLGGIKKLSKVTSVTYHILSSKGLTFPWLTT